MRGFRWSVGSKIMDREHSFRRPCTFSASHWWNWRWCLLSLPPPPGVGNQYTLMSSKKYSPCSSKSKLKRERHLKACESFSQKKRAWVATSSLFMLLDSAMGLNAVLPCSFVATVTLLYLR